MFARFLKRLVSLLPSYTITIDGVPYLTRYYVLLRDWKWFNIYVHHFHTSDQGDNLHNHPWKWARSLILSGGYAEELRQGDVAFIEQRLVLPGTINRIKHGTFHRVDLLDETEGAWSLLITGPRVTVPPEWGFWDRHTGKFKYFKENPEAIA